MIIIVEEGGFFFLAFSCFFRLLVLIVSFMEKCGGVLRGVFRLIPPLKETGIVRYRGVCSGTAHHS